MDIQTTNPTAESEYIKDTISHMGSSSLVQVTGSDLPKNDPDPPRLVTHGLAATAGPAQCTNRGAPAVACR